jgi:broad specificity phosphatase PhoE
MSEIYMIRHGQASFGSENYDRLSPVGAVQAEILADHLLKTGLRFDAVYTGGMERQEKTAAALLDATRKQGLATPHLIREDAWNEYDSQAVFTHQLPEMVQENPSLSGDVERIYSDRKAFQVLFQQAMTRWASGKFDMSGSPRWKDFRNRVQQGVREIMRRQGPKKRLAVFTSGGPISVTVQMALDLSDEKAMAVSWQIMNTSVTRFKYKSNDIALAGFNDVSHLMLKGDRNLLTYR